MTRTTHRPPSSAPIPPPDDTVTGQHHRRPPPKGQSWKQLHSPKLPSSVPDTINHIVHAHTILDDFTILTNRQLIGHHIHSFLERPCTLKVQTLNVLKRSVPIRPITQSKTRAFSVVHERSTIYIQSALSIYHQLTSPIFYPRMTSNSLVFVIITTRPNYKFTTNSFIASDAFDHPILFCRPCPHRHARLFTHCTRSPPNNQTPPSVLCYNFCICPLNTATNQTGFNAPAL